MWWIVALALVIFVLLLPLMSTGKPCICEDSDHCTCGGAWGGRK